MKTINREQGAKAPTKKGQQMKIKDITSEIYNSIDKRSSLFRWLDKDQSSIILDGDVFRIERPDFSDWIPDKAWDQIHTLMRERYNAVYLYDKYPLMV